MHVHASSRAALGDEGMNLIEMPRDIICRGIEDPHDLVAEASTIHRVVIIAVVCHAQHMRHPDAFEVRVSVGPSHTTDIEPQPHLQEATRVRGENVVMRCIAGVPRRLMRRRTQSEHLPFGASHSVLL